MLREMISKASKERIFQDAVEVLSDGFFYNECDDAPYESERLEGFYWSSGACKVCISFPNFVLKTSFKGSVFYREDDDLNELDELDFNKYEDFGSDGSILRNAETEYFIYQAAVEEGLERFFTETIKINDKVFAQERVDQMVSEVFDMWDVSERAASFCLAHTVPFCSRIVQLMFKNGESEESITKLLNFLDKFDIDDLHSNNIGIIDEKVKIFDFAGFCSNSADLSVQWAKKQKKI